MGHDCRAEIKRRLTRHLGHRGGRFGSLALERLPGRVTKVVEPAPDEGLLALAHAQGAEVVQAQGVDILPPPWPGSAPHLGGARLAAPSAARLAT